MAQVMPIVQLREFPPNPETQAMRKPRATAIALCALLTLAPTNPMFAIETTPRKAVPTSSTVPKGPLDSTCGPQLQAGVWTQTPAGDRRVRRLEGRDADAFLTTLRGGNPEWRNIHTAAIAALAAKGFKPATGIEGETVVIQVEKRKSQNAAVVKPPSALARLMNFFMPTAHAAQIDDQLYTAEGVIWSSAWDDGDPATWEGVVGVHEYAYGNYGEGGTQMRNDTEDVNAANVWSSGSVTQPGLYDGATAYNHGIRSVLGCSAGACIGVGLKCWILGPFTMNCVLIGCGLAVAGCVFGTYIQMALDGQTGCPPGAARYGTRCIFSN